MGDAFAQRIRGFGTCRFTGGGSERVPVTPATDVFCGTHASLSAMIPLCGDVRLGRALEEILSLAYPFESFAADYTGARAYARRAEHARASEERAAAPVSRRVAEDFFSFFHERYGPSHGTVRAVRTQLILVAVAERWGELKRRGLVKEAGAEVFGLRHISPVLLKALLNVRATVSEGPLGLRLDSRGVRKAIQKATDADNDER